MIDIWVFFSLIMSFAMAGMFLVNEYFKASSLHMLFWMRLITLTILLPIIFFIPPPTDTIFYAGTITSALLFAYVDIMLIGLVAASGAGVVSRIEPLSVGLTFILWLLITPSLALDYIDQPIRGIGIVLSLSGALYFAMALRRCEITSQALKYLLPSILLIALGTLGAKIAMDHSPPLSGVVYYAVIQCIIVLAAYIAILLFKPRVDWFRGVNITGQLKDRGVILGGICLSVTWLMGVPSKQYALSLVENPSYVTLFGLLSPVIILLIYRLVGRREEANVTAGLGIVACAALLIIFTRL